MVERLTLLILALTGMTEFVSCSSSSNASHTATLRIPLYGSPGTPDPVTSTSTAGTFLTSLLYSGLLKFSPDLHVIPELAVSIPTISNDGKTYTFTVRHDARFVNGRRCMASDVAFSLSRALSPELHSNLARRYLGNIVGARQVEQGALKSLSGVHIVNDLTLRIRLIRPDPQFLDKLTFPVASIVDKQAVTRSSRNGWDQPAGTGPWMIVRRNRDGSLLLKPRIHYYGGHMQLKSVVLVPVRDEQHALDLYRRGQLDVVRVPATMYGAMETRTDFRSTATFDGFYALTDPGVSLILAAHLDRDKLAQAASPALSPLETIVPPAVPDYVSSPPNPSSPSAPPPLGVRLRPSPVSDALGTALAHALAKQWSIRRAGGVPVTIVHAGFLLPDPAVWLRMMFSRTRSAWYHHILRRTSDLTNDPVTRLSSYSRLENWALQQGLVIPLASANAGYLVKPYVQGVQVTPLGIMPANNNWSSVSVT